jgi:SNF2 family DNA or RNA helicase
MSGAVNAATRTETVAAFQAGRLRGIALTIGAGGVGLTLTRSPHALFVDLAWTPADNSQAEDRVYRIGQTRGVTITRLIADHPIDQHVTRLLTVKQRTIAASVEASAVGGAS